MRGKALQGPIAPAVPFTDAQLNQFTSVPQPGFDFQFGEIGGGHTTGGLDVASGRIDLSVPADLVYRRFYIYMWMDADSTVAVQMQPKIDLYNGSALVGSIPLWWGNIFTPLGNPVLQKSIPNFAGDLNRYTAATGPANDTVVAGQSLNNCISLFIWDPWPGGFPNPNYTMTEPGSTTGFIPNPVLVRPYEMNIRIDRVVIAPWSPTAPNYHGRIWLGVMSLHP